MRGILKRLFNVQETLPRFPLGYLSVCVIGMARVSNVDSSESGKVDILGVCSWCTTTAELLSRKTLFDPCYVAHIPISYLSTSQKAIHFSNVCKEDAAVCYFSYRKNFQSLSGSKLKCSLHILSRIQRPVSVISDLIASSCKKVVRDKRKKNLLNFDSWLFVYLVNLDIECRLELY